MYVRRRSFPSALDNTLSRTHAISRRVVAQSGDPTGDEVRVDCSDRRAGDDALQLERADDKSG